jgi:Tfp pilus assembly protein PilX
MKKEALMRRRRVLGNQEGIALVMALGVMLVLTVSLVAIIDYSSTNTRSAERGEAKTLAIDVAEAGFGRAAAVLAEASNPSDPAALPAGSTTIEGSTASWSGTLSGFTWTVTSVSTVPNPTGGTAISHTVTGQFLVSPSMAGNEAWEYAFANTTSCTVIQNTVTVYAPIYTRGDLCLKNGVELLGTRVYTKGGIQTEDTARVGTSPSDATDPEVRSVLGCKNPWGGSYVLACTTDATKRVWRSSFGNTVPDVTKPPLDMTYWRLNAKPGPNQYCTSGSFPGGPGAFTSTGAVDLFPASSYDCRVYAGATLVGQLAWNDTTKVFTIGGTAYFDGELVAQGGGPSAHGTYTGKGVIYFAKKVNIKDDREICAVAACATTGWDPNSTLLVIVSGASDVPGFELQNNAKFQGAAYSEGGFKLQNSATLHGPTIGEVLDVQNNGFPASWPPLTSVLPGMPQNPSTGGTVTFVEGSWRG